MNSFNPMSLGNVQLPQAPMGPRAASPMNHSVQMNSMASVPGVSAPPLSPCSVECSLRRDTPLLPENFRGLIHLNLSIVLFPCFLKLANKQDCWYNEDYLNADFFF